jgi:hypothetical protein
MHHTGPRWPTYFATIGDRTPEDDTKGPVSAAVLSRRLGRTVTAWIERVGFVPTACIVFYLDTWAMVTPQAQQGFDTELLKALPPTCVVAGAAAEGITCDGIEVTRRQMRDLPCVASLLFVNTTNVVVNSVPDRVSRPCASDLVAHMHHRLSTGIVGVNIALCVIDTTHSLLSHE